MSDGDAAGVADAVETLWQKPELREALGQGARRFVVEQRDSEVVWKQRLDVFEELCVEWAQVHGT